MSIDFDNFLSWAESRFDNVVVKENEIKLNSIFCEDTKYHLWCNPKGGKNNYQYGVYHCWKTDKKGSLINLVMQVDKCSFEDAIQILEVSNYKIEELEKKVQDIFNKKLPKIEKKIEQEEEEKKQELNLPLGTYQFDDLPSSNIYKKKAEEYLKKRKLSKGNLFVCVSGKYKNRIIIPYYDKNKKLIYYNSRSLDDSKLRYLGPPKEIGVGKGDVLFVPCWPVKGEKIYLTEGEFDAISLNQCGYNSGAFGGKNLTPKQLEIIKEYIPVLCLDADKSGAEALIKMGDFLLKNGFNEIHYVRAPKEHKDWNKMLEKDGEKVLKYYIKMNETKYDYTVGVKLKIK